MLQIFLCSIIAINLSGFVHYEGKYTALEVGKVGVACAIHQMRAEVEVFRSYFQSNITYRLFYKYNKAFSVERHCGGG